MSLSYTHVQASASATWTIAHNLNSAPICDVVQDDGGIWSRILPENVEHVDLNNMIITFSTPISGVARLIGTYSYSFPTVTAVDLGLNDIPVPVVFNFADTFAGSAGPIDGHSPGSFAGMTVWGGDAVTINGSGKALLYAANGTASTYGFESAHETQFVGFGSGFFVAFTFGCVDDDAIFVQSGAVANIVYKITCNGPDADTADAGKVVVQYGTQSITEFSMSTAVVEHRDVEVKVSFEPAAQEVLVDGNSEATETETLETDAPNFSGVRLTIAALGIVNRAILLDYLNVTEIV